MSRARAVRTNANAPRRGARLTATMAVAGLVVAAISTVTTTGPVAQAAGPGVAVGLLALRATRGPNPAVLDAAGRQVILRGQNLNTLGDYYQANLSLAPTYPYADADLAEMARYGVNVVRLIVSWSKLEPTQGTIDVTYVGQIRHAV